MAETVYASFVSPSDAERAAGALMDYGVRSADLSVVMRDYAEARRDFAAHSATLAEPSGVGRAPAQDYRAGEPRDEVRGRDRERDTATKVGLSTTTPADAGSGAAKGAGIGLGLGILAALASVAVPGVGLVFGGGALALAIAGAAATTAAGAITGGVFGYLKDQGMPEHAARAFEQVYEQGGAILAIRTPSANVDRITIEGILAKYGATSVNTYAAAA